MKNKLTQGGVTWWQCYCLQIDRLKLTEIPSGIMAECDDVKKGEAKINMIATCQDGGWNENGDDGDDV